MNIERLHEERLAREICGYLDQSADQLPYRIQQRLMAARQKALSGAVPNVAGLARGAVRAAGPEAVDGQSDTAAPLWWRVGATVLPALLLIAGFVMADSIQQEKAVEDLAEVNSALVTDDLPLVAYIDNGFGVYLKNTRR